MRRAPYGEEVRATAGPGAVGLFARSRRLWRYVLVETELAKGNLRLVLEIDFSCV